MRALKAFLTVILVVAGASVPLGAVAQEPGWLGLKVGTVTPAVAAARKLNVQFGALVLEVEKDSPASKVDLRPGDVVLNVNGRAVINKDEFESALGRLAPGAKVELIRLRNRESAKVIVTLTARPRPVGPPPGVASAARPQLAPASPSASAAAPKAAPPKAARPAPAGPSFESERSVALAPPPPVPAPGGAAPTTPAPAQAQPQPEPKAEERIVPFGGTLGRMRGMSASDEAAAQWDVVPVFYGTDRVAEPQPARASYGSGRGKRLELGRALITVPKSHEVPQVERPWVYRLPFTSIVLYREREDPNRHFTLKEVRVLTEDEFLSLVRERIRASRVYKDHALVFVHGFNTTFDNALFRTAQIAYDLKFDGAPFLYSWPSSGQVGLQDYSYDRESTGQAEPYFQRFLQLVTQQTGAKSVSLIAHSMGNQLLLAVLRDIKRAAPTGVVVSEVILAAPDVDRDTFEFVAKEIRGVSRGVTLLAASNDRALEISRQFWGGVPRAGDVPATGPVIVPGVDTIDITATSTDVFSLNHSGYAEQPMLLGDIQTLIRTGQRPPGKRVPSLQLVKTDKGEYWRYPTAK
jgi:esterase/lipase superfamily enzyme